MNCCSGLVSEGSNDRVLCNGAHADKRSTSGSEVSLELPEVESLSSPSSESDEIDGARKVPLLRGDLKRVTFT